MKLGKSPGIVILDKSAHLTKIKAILYDSSKFTKTPNDNQAVEIDKTLYDELLLSNQQGIIDTGIFERLRPAGTIIPKL